MSQTVSSNGLDLASKDLTDFEDIYVERICWRFHHTGARNSLLLISAEAKNKK